MTFLLGVDIADIIINNPVFYFKVQLNYIDLKNKFYLELADKLKRFIERGAF